MVDPGFLAVYEEGKDQATEDDADEGRRLPAMAKGDRPYNKDEAVRAATFVNQLLAMSWDAFAPGTDTGAPTKAKPEIWKEPAKFKQLADAAQAESLKLVAAAQAGDLAALRPAVGAMGKSCNNCHDDFQSK